MMNIECIVDKMVQSEVVQAEDKDIYLYGLDMLIAMVTHTVATIIIGLALGEVWACIIFLLTYNPIRSYAGGYHAKTHRNCFICSCLIIVAFSCVMRSIPPQQYLMLIIICLPLASFAIITLAPVADLNKPLDRIEQQMYRKKTRKVLVIELAVSIVIIFFGFYKTALAITLSLTILAIIMIMGQMKLKLTNVEEI